MVGEGKNIWPDVNIEEGKHLFNFKIASINVILFIFSC
jgi:hypothetical protein